MAKKQEFERVGGGRYDIYRPKPKKSFWESAGEVIGAIVLGVLVLGVMGAIFG
tara:strand:+ start:33748 stop:33906 length:159 start_codon:yes stop_codon:yes gene_type:complete